MEHESPPLYSRGPYRVVQCRAGDGDRPGALPRFVIVTGSGERLHETVSFDAARVTSSGVGRDWSRRDATKPCPCGVRPHPDPSSGPRPGI